MPDCCLEFRACHLDKRMPRPDGLWPCSWQPASPLEPVAQRNSIVFRFPLARPNQRSKNHGREAAKDNYYEPLPFHETNLAGWCQIQKAKAIAVFMRQGKIRRPS
jgi:hypothetical protein